MNFSEVEKALGSKLPPSAYDYQAWWSNYGGKSHVQAKGWLDAGYETAQVDMTSQKLVFKRMGKTVHGGSGMSDITRAFEHPSTAKQSRRSPLFGALKGTFVLVPPSADEPPPEDPESWESLNLAKLDKLLFGQDE